MGTIRQHKGRPTLMPRSLRGMAVPDVMKRYHECLSYLNQNFVAPESEAIEFYLKNAAIARVFQTVPMDAPLGEFEPLLESYHDTIRLSSLRMFYYLLLICTRESRHCGAISSYREALTSEHGKTCTTFTYGIRGLCSEDAVTKLLSTPPDVMLGDYVEYLVAVFEKGSQYGAFSGGYGGKPWARIARVLRDFVHGVLSAELMLDTAYTLAHNNGPIFNKNILYSQYSKTELLTILDVQRAGLIPQFVDSSASKFIESRAAGFHNMAADLIEGFKGTVDWDAVEKAGAVQTYAHLKNQAKNKAKLDALSHDAKKAEHNMDPPPAQANAAEGMSHTIAGKIFPMVSRQELVT